MLEDVSDDHEVGGDGDTEHGKGGQDGGNAYPEEEIKQTQLQEIIKDVCRLYVQRVRQRTHS